MNYTAIAVTMKSFSATNEDKMASWQLYVSRDTYSFHTAINCYLHGYIENGGLSFHLIIV